MIDRVRMTGYKLLDDFSADLGQLTVLIGANSTGKSTFLDCLQFIAHSMHSPLNAVAGVRGGIRSMLSASADANTIKWEITFRKPQDNPAWRDRGFPPSLGGYTTRPKL